MSSDKKLIIFTGGGTGGSVTPLLALAEELEGHGFDFAWIGTRSGVELRMVAEQGIEYYPIAAGKFRRYLSWRNFVDPLYIAAGFFQSLSLLSSLKPRLVVTAGGFVSVPVVWAAWALRIKVIVHQQDIRPGLANRLMAPCASAITVTFPKSLKDYGTKARLTGNPVRRAFKNALAGNSHPPQRRPRILILGGGTGSEALNALTLASVPALAPICDIVHVTGVEKKESLSGQSHYQAYPFVNVATMAHEMSQADLVITRAGLGTLSELSFLGKPTVIIPMPGTHQEDNASFFERRHAALVLNQNELTPAVFSATITRLLKDDAWRDEFGTAMKLAMTQGANEALAKLILEME